ncbi:3D domain-containing protein [Ferviditalea candida]|uniref:3D domain-containing protein n=1 Tax=Ferviditalea candida TaxID=3108399 RepID=A0ABU5ZF06_9BACL|nr:3D domain-containing protein [Paenibacillaceae bacterium T2]
MRNKLVLTVCLTLVAASCLSFPAYARFIVDDHIYYCKPINSSGPSKSNVSFVEQAKLQLTEAQSSHPEQRYTVAAGDTLYRIAMNYGTTVDQLMSANGIDDPRLLQVGQILRLPSGKRETPVQTASQEQQRNFLKVIHATLTAYTAGVESTGKTPSHPEYGITFSGTRAREGRTIAVDPSIIPLGSTVYIEGIGIRRAEDTGSAIKGARVDVFMNDVKQALRFGVKKNAKVYVLSVPDKRTAS